MTLTPEQIAGLEAINGDHQPFPRTDLGNAERLVAQHGADFRYANELGWLCWDGKRWQPDSDGEAVRRMKLTARSIYAEAARTEATEERRALVKWGERSESKDRIMAALELAKSERAIVVSISDLDADPLLLNVENGTLDLRTGKLRRHDPGDLITKLAPVAFDPQAHDEKWDYFLESTTAHDPEFASFLLRAIGYTLTGSTSEEVLFFPHGPTASGKSTLIEALKGLLGDYARTADFNSFINRRNESGMNNDIARLTGARFVPSVEVDEGKKLAEGLIKKVTGGDTITARRMYQDFFEFKPQFKLWLVANYRPEVNADDSAVWRRIVQLPFTESLPEGKRDPELKRHLRDDPGARSAILRAAVEGCLEWQRVGLAIPDRVTAYTEEYRAENDKLSDWISACCEFKPPEESPWVASRTLRDSYEAYCELIGETPVSRQKFAAALTERGAEKTRQPIALEALGGGRGQAFRGIRLVDQ